jgi:hypothetical protein
MINGFAAPRRDPQPTPAGVSDDLLTLVRIYGERMRMWGAAEAAGTDDAALAARDAAMARFGEIITFRRFEHMPDGDR